jgi:TRAP transporter TAXI family solute receptor
MVLFGCLAVLGLILIAQPAVAAKKVLFGSTATTSSHYTYTVSAGQAINAKAGDKVQATVVATGGAVDNLARIGRGQLNLGIGTWATFFQAYKGMGKYKGKPKEKIRALWLYSSNAQNYVVRADSGIKTLAGLTGKKFCPGLRGSATEQLVQQLLTTAGVKPDYFRGSLADAVAAVKDNRIAGYAKAGAGLQLDASTKELKAFTKIVLLNWPKDKVAMVNKAMPFVNFISLKKDEVPGFPAYTTPVQAIGVIAFDNSLTEDQAYNIVKGINEGLDIQVAAYPAMKGLSIPKITMELTKFPLHKGAIKYYREIGVKIPQRLIPPEAK